MMEPESDRRWFETRWSGRLRNLGFTLDHIVRCRSIDSGRILIPGSIRGEPVQFLFGTNNGWWCSLYQSYVEARGLPVFLNDDGRERARAGEVRVFGRMWQANGVPFGDTVANWQPPLAGRFGAYCLMESVVAIDASVPAMAVVSADQRPALAGALCRVPLIPKTWKGTCYTAAVSDAVFGVGYEWHSTVTPAYLATRRTRAGRNGRAEIELRLPGDIAVTQEVGVADACNVAPLAEAGITRCDGMLGADFWCRWITVFDFPASELLLFPYD
jgi:hypothetical protein